MEIIIVTTSCHNNSALLKVSDLSMDNDSDNGYKNMFLENKKGNTSFAILTHNLSKINRFQPQKNAKALFVKLYKILF